MGQENPNHTLQTQNSTIKLVNFYLIKDVNKKISLRCFSEAISSNNVCFKKTMTHLLLYTVVSVSSFF